MNFTKRRVAVWAVAAVAVLGLTACSGSPSGDAETSTDSSAPVEESTSNQTVAEACASMSEPLQEVSSQMLELANVSSDPQATVDAWASFTTTFGEVVEGIENSEVKAAAGDAHADLVLVGEAISKTYLDSDIEALGELSDATSEMQTSFTALSELCTSSL